MTANSVLRKVGFPAASRALDEFGFKFSDGGAHISRTMMLNDLDAALTSVPSGSTADYRKAIVEQNILGKGTESTRKESLRRLRELYALGESTPIFALLRKLHAIDSKSLPQLAMQVAWTRDPLLRATTPAVIEARAGDRVETVSLTAALKAAFPNQYTDETLNQTARHAASSWTQSGHLAGRTNKTRQWITPSVTAITLALFLGHISGHYGSSVFSSPWCRLLDLNLDRARGLGLEAHRAGLINLHAVGEVVDLRFPMLAELERRLS